jgi:hypothetical protein
MYLVNFLQLNKGKFEVKETIFNNGKICMYNYGMDHIDINCKYLMEFK